MKKLYKSNTDKVFTGVIGGIGEYFDTDPTILRLAFILILITTGIFPAVIGYIIAAAVVPNKPKEHFTEASYSEKTEDNKETK